MSALMDAKAVVFDMLTAAAWPVQAPTISWGPPSKAEDTNTPLGEHVFFDQSIIEVPAETLYAHRGWREEFDIRVIVDVYQEGDVERDVEARADVLYDAVVGVFNQARATHIAGTVDQLSGWTSNRILAPYGVGWKCQITVEQACVNAVQSP